MVVRGKTGLGWIACESGRSWNQKLAGTKHENWTVFRK